MGDSPPLALFPRLARRPRVPCRLNILLPLPRLIIVAVFLPHRRPSCSKETPTALPKAGWRKAKCDPPPPACLPASLSPHGPSEQGGQGLVQPGLLPLPPLNSSFSPRTPQIAMSSTPTSTACMNSSRVFFLARMARPAVVGRQTRHSFFCCENAREIAIGEDRLTVKYPTLSGYPYREYPSGMSLGWSHSRWRIQQ